MEKMVAYCGITCTDCPAFVATHHDDDAERAKVAKMWSEHFEVNLQPGEINCDGCLADSDRLFNHCRVCEIRSCGQERAVVNCAQCDDYGCEKLIKFLDMVPEAKETLEQIRADRAS
jgi:hypothetical protein